MRLLIITLFCPFILLSQNIVFETSDITIVLGDIQNSISVGNPCGVDNRIVTNVYGDMNMNFHPLDIYNADITVHGDIVNEGTIRFMCDNAILTVLGETLSTEEPPDITRAIKMYPNPAQNFVNVDAKGIREILIANMSGQIVKHYQTSTERNQISISNLSSGAYLVQVTFDNGFIDSKTLIKQ